MRCLIYLGLAVACAQFIYLAMLVGEHSAPVPTDYPADDFGGSSPVSPATPSSKKREQDSEQERREAEQERQEREKREREEREAARETSAPTVEPKKPSTKETSQPVRRSDSSSSETTIEVMREAEATPETVRRRVERVTDFVRFVHASFASIRPPGFGVRNSADRATDRKVWETFYAAVDSALFKNNEDEPKTTTTTTSGRFAALQRHAPRRRRPGHVFVSISSFRDEVCADTLVHMYDTASDPTSLAVGVVQQNCDEQQHANFGCFTAVMPEDLKVHAAPPDVDCVDTFCDLRPALCADLKARGALRVLRFNESETFGPVFGRYLGSLLWFGEEYYAQVDAHTTFAQHWDDMLREDYALAPSSKAVFSHYPPSGPQKPGPRDDGKPYQWEGAPGPCMCDAAFAEYDIVRIGAMQRYPFKETSPAGCTALPKGGECRRVPRFAPFIGAGFVFANASFLLDVPFDPFLPFIFMGEELDFAARLWTAGWDIFCPPRAVLAHAYLRPQKPKFWGALQRSIGAGTHNSLQQFVLPRVKHKVGYPEAATLDPPSLKGHLDLFGLGTARSLADFLRIVDLDFVHKRNARVEWCKEGDRPPTFLPEDTTTTAAAGDVDLPRS